MQPSIQRQAATYNPGEQKMKSIERASLLVLACGLGMGPIPYAVAQDTLRLGFEEVIVTARKRAETLQEVPLAVSVITSEEIKAAGIQDSTDLVARVPSLYFATGAINFPTSSHIQLTMRGVGFNAALEPAVGVFVDGMYEPHIAYDIAFLDAERIEVLRGPQGTLFGRNTQAGALNIVSRKPDENFRGSLQAEYAEFNSSRIAAGLSGPLGDTVFASLSAQYSQTDGYIDNVTLDRDQGPSELVVGRGILRWNPSDNLDVSFIADASRRDYNEIGRGVPIGPERYVSISDEEEDELNETAGLQLNIDYKFGPNLTLTSITGWREANTDTWVDADGTPTADGTWVVPVTPPYTPEAVTVQGATLNARIDQDFRSQELRLAGDGDRFDWLFGLYYFDRYTDDDLERFLGVGVAPPTSALGVYFLQDFWEERKGYAGFGQFNFRPVDRLELSIGARYSEEDVETGGVRTFYRSNGTSNPPVFKDFEDTFDNVSMMASIAFDVSSSLNTYLTYAEGWKAGGVNRAPASAAQVQPYEEEYSTTYELGLKSTLAAGKVTLNGAVFYIDLEDQQLPGFVPVPGSTPVLLIANAGSSEVRGVELELALRPSERFELSTSLAYNDTELKEFVRVFSAVNTFDMSGLDFEDVPEFTGSVQTLYRTRPELLFGGGLEFRLSYRYVDEVTTQDQGVGTTASSQLVVPDYDRLDGRVSWVRDDGWRLTLFVDNVLDSFDYTRVTTPAWTPNIPFGTLVMPLEPRQFGVTITKTF